MIGKPDQYAISFFNCDTQYNIVKGKRIKTETMTRALLFILSLVLFGKYGISTSAHDVKQDKSDSIGIEAARGVIQRTLRAAAAPSLVDDFQFELSLSREITTSLRSKVLATEKSYRGSSPVALTRSFYHYLKYSCNGSVSWGANGTGIELGRLRFASSLPPPVASERIVGTAPFRYMYTYCTLSYSLAFASMQDWVDQIDWLALHGMNMPLGGAWC